MIKRANGKYITYPADPDQLFNLEKDPLELDNLAANCDKEDEGAVCGDCIGQSPLVRTILTEFRAEAKAKWDMDAITKAAKKSQRRNNDLTLEYLASFLHTVVVYSRIPRHQL